MFIAVYSSEIENGSVMLRCVTERTDDVSEVLIEDSMVLKSSHEPRL